MQAPHVRRSSPAAYLRLIVGAVSAGLASLSVVEAQTWNQLVLTIGVTEWGHVLAPLGLAGLLPAWRREPAGRAGTALGLAAAGLALSSLVRGALLARRLPAQVAAAYGEALPRALPGAPPRPRPLVALDVLRGVRSPRVCKQRLTYVTRDDLDLALDLYQPAKRTNDERTGGKGVRMGVQLNALPAHTNAPTTNGEGFVLRPSSFVLDDQAHEPRPCVVVIHGGSWHNGDSNQIPALNSYLAARGYIVAAINYRLAPRFRFPAATDDVLAAIDFLKANAGELGIDPHRFVLLGRSAGGHLALLTAYTATDPAIRGAIAFYAPTDLIWGYNHPAKKRIIDGIPLVEAFLGGSPNTLPDAYTVASPLYHAGSACPPTLLIHGGRDNLVSPLQSEMLADRLQAAGCRHLYLNLPWATHGCDANFSGPSGQISTYAIERFLATVVG